MAVAQANFKRDADDLFLDVTPRLTSTSTLDPALSAESAREAAPGSILVTADDDILSVNLTGGVRVKERVAARTIAGSELQGITDRRACISFMA